MKKLSSIFFILIGLLLIASMPVLAEEAVQGQPAATAVTTAAPVAPAVAAVPTAAPEKSVVQQALDTVKNLQVGIDTTWVLITAFLVFL